MFRINSQSNFNLLDYQKSRIERYINYLNSIVIKRDEEEYKNLRDKITFIIPSINRNTLIRTVQSLVDQKNPSWEAIIIYDGVKGQEFMDERIKTICIEKIGENKGNGRHGRAGLVRNFGINLCETKWIGFLDDDDTLDSHYVETLFEKYLNYSIVVWRMKREDGSIIPNLNCNKIEKGNVGISFCYKNLYKNLNFYFNGETEDFDFLIRLINLFKDYIICPEIYYNIEH